MDPSPPKPEPARQRRGGPRPLQPADLVTQGERLSREQRQERDRHRLLTMQLEGYDGPTWRNEVQPDVWAYAIRVLPKMIESGEIFNIRARLGAIPADDLTLSANGISREDAEDLASEVAIGAISVFHDQLKAGVWDLSKDMTFRSWFVGLCAHRIAGPYRKWLREQARRPGALDPDVEVLDTEPGPSSVIYVVEFKRYLGMVKDPITKTMITMDTAYYSDAEIADATRATVKTVEGRLAKARRDARRRRDVEDRRDRSRDFGSGVA